MKLKTKADGKNGFTIKPIILAAAVLAGSMSLLYAMVVTKTTTTVPIASVKPDAHPADKSKKTYKIDVSPNPVATGGTVTITVSKSCDDKSISVYVGTTAVSRKSTSGDWSGDYTAPETGGEYTVTATDSCDDTFDPVTLTVVQLTGLTVVSRNPKDVKKIDGADWACVKADDYVYVKATLSTTDKEAAKLIHWSVGDQDSSDSLQVKVSRSASTKIPVTATVGSSSSSLNVWVIWAMLNFDMDPNDTLSTVTSGALNFFAKPHLQRPLDNDNLGVGYFSWNGVFFNTAISASPSVSATEAVGKMCVTATITPTGINRLTGINSLGWRIYQERDSKAFKNGKGVSHRDFPKETTTGWISDSDADQSGINMTTELDSNDKLYHSDSPSEDTARFGASNRAAEYSNFRDVVIWNGQLCSSKDNLWHCNFTWIPTSNRSRLIIGGSILPISARQSIATLNLKSQYSRQKSAYDTIFRTS